MSINHARSTVALYISASGTEEINSPTFASHDAVTVETFTAPTGGETGATANRATLVYSNDAALVASGSLNLDFTAAVSVQPSGTSTFTRINAVWLKAGDTSINIDSSLGLVPSMDLPAGGTLCITSPTGVAIGAAQLDITNNSGAAAGSLQILILGS